MSNPFENPLVRHGIGLGGAVMVAVASILFLEGTLQLLGLLVAAADLILTPQILKYTVGSG